MVSILSLLAPFFGLIAIGYGTGRVARLGLDAMGWMNIFIIYAALPALFFRLVSRTPAEQLIQWRFIATDVGATYSIFLLVLVIALAIRRTSLAESTLQAFGAAYGNIGYMGPGLALIAIGERAAVPVALIVSVENAIHFMVAPALMAIAGSDKRGVLRIVRDILVKVLLHPFILSCLAGAAVALLKIPVPEPVYHLTEMLSQSAAPCALFAMGVTLALRPMKRIPREITWIVPAKLILHPLVMAGFMIVFGPFDRDWMEAAILLAALPSAANVFVIGQQYRVWQEKASATILMSTVLSVVSVTLVIYLLRLTARY